MKNAETWTPTKYVLRGEALRANKDRRHLAVSSRLVGQLVADEYQRALPSFASGDLLDVGCGTVPLYGSYRHLVASTLCLDWPSSLHEARFIDVWCDLAAPLPLTDSCVDTVISSDVLEHLPDAPLAMREMARVLRPGGILILNTPFLYRVHEAPHDYCRHTRHSLERLAVLAGFEVVQLREIGGAADVLTDNLAKMLEQVPLIGPMLAAWAQGLAIAFGRTVGGRRVRQRTAAVFPLGHLLVARVPPGGHNPPKGLQP